MHYALLIKRKEITEPQRRHICLWSSKTWHSSITQPVPLLCIKQHSLEVTSCQLLLLCCSWGSILIWTVCDCTERERQTSLNRWENIRLLPVWQASVVTATCCGAALIGICMNGGWAGSCVFCPEKNGSFLQTAPCWEAPVAFSCGQWPGITIICIGVWVQWTSTQSKSHSLGSKTWMPMRIWVEGPFYIKKQNI